MKKSLLTVLTSAILLVYTCLTGCIKGPSETGSILGTWTPSTIQKITYVNNVVTDDTTITLSHSNTNISSITFFSIGQYSEIIYPSGVDSIGTYSYSGGILTLGLANGTNLGLPASLIGNKLVITLTPDTLGKSPLTIVQRMFTLVN